MLRTLIKNPLNITSIKNPKLSNIILLRHAESEFNKSISLLGKNTKELNLPKNEIRKMQKFICVNKEYIDSPITKLGNSQCQKAGQDIQDLNIKYVFVSPLKRCLETCRIILENKINRDLNNSYQKKYSSDKEIINETNKLLNENFEKKNLNEDLSLKNEINNNSNLSHFNYSTSENSNKIYNENYLHLKQIIREKKSEIKIIVHPYLFEKIEDSCDLIDDIFFNKDEYNYYDWSLFNNFGFDKSNILFYQSKFCDIVHNDFFNEREIKDSYQNHFYFENINKEILKNQISEKLKIKELYHEMMVDAIQRLFDNDQYIESSRQTIERLNYFKEFILNFIDMKKVKFNNSATDNYLKNNINDDEKILIVGHSILFKHFTSNYLTSQDMSPGPNEYKLGNCELLGIKINF